MGFLQPPATISEVHGEPGDVDEYFILEDDAGNTILAPDARGVLKPRKVRRSEIRSLVPMARKLRSTRSRRSTDSASAHSSFRLNSTDSAAVALKLDAHEVLLTRMRVRFVAWCGLLSLSFAESMQLLHTRSMRRVGTLRRSDNPSKKSNAWTYQPKYYLTGNMWFHFFQLQLLALIDLFRILMSMTEFLVSPSFSLGSLHDLCSVIAIVF